MTKKIFAYGDPQIGYGYTYSKYNTLMHFLNVVEAYWHNPDLNNIQIFGKVR